MAIRCSEKFRKTLTKRDSVEAKRRYYVLCIAPVGSSPVKINAPQLKQPLRHSNLDRLSVLDQFGHLDSHLSDFSSTFFHYVSLSQRVHCSDF